MNNKYSGKKTDFLPVRDDEGRIAISYGMEEVDETNATWYEVYFYKTQVPNPTIEQVKKAVEDDINSQTDEKILSGFVWNDINVWLSSENQRNFSEAQRMAEALPNILPLTFKLGETEDGTPVYHTFETVAELGGFYMQAFAYINQCLNKGWQRKDSIDWQPYEDALNPENPEVFAQQS